MAEITAALVKELRELTGLGMMECKKALTEAGGDIKKAEELLRVKSGAKASKAASRIAAEGVIGTYVSPDGKVGALVELNSETDFVAKNEDFVAFAKSLAEIAATRDPKDVEELSALDLMGTKIEARRQALVQKIGENMTIRRMEKLTVNDGVVVGYVHNAVAPGLGKIGVLIALESTGDKAKLEALGKQIAMHTAAAFPKFLHRDHVDASVLEREKNVLREQAIAEGKKPEIVEKMLDGRVRKFYEEIVLLEQDFVMDPDTKINKLLENATKDVGAPIALTGYARIQLGEGIEKEEVDFAAEVAATAKRA